MQLGLNTKDSLGHARRLDGFAGGRGEAGDGPLGDAMRRVDGAGIGGLDEVLGDDVDAALAGVDEVAQRVLGAVEAAREAQHEHGRVRIHHVEVAEGRQVLRAAFALRRAEADGSRYDRRYQEFVVERCWPSLLVRVDGDVLTRFAGLIISTVAEGP